jgi:hypothetical protein
MANASFSNVGRSALLAVILAGGVVAACEGGSAGDKCTKQSDCNNSLTCQPVQGRDSDYCCGSYGPEVPESDIPANCRPLDDAGATPAPTSTTAEDAESPPATDGATGG